MSKRFSPATLTLTPQEAIIADMNVPQTEGDVLTLDEAAELLRLHQHTLRKLARAGAVPATKYGRQWRFSRRLLEEHLREKSQTDSEG